mmetsp:Transcript_79302/g.220519  ORF Transcript_79302/g.220519 Transcript_79302/m.220519 type:complete len:397 (-) Transcript_79302:97-1287(-)|eukprot:CAMPEP_0117514868 /NCGR_PEP_ID=MMETSP0784-20121206/30287_1 /TAXON_ID=39447 /ORGANISM="" /LENGTH=396 /DNA_ID=CAMNT_0005310669 /DNA_START=63 /DNA_END=1253 /DNA_ORIENTATION=+
MAPFGGFFRCEVDRHIDALFMGKVDIELRGPEIFQGTKIQVWSESEESWLPGIVVSRSADRAKIVYEINGMLKTKVAYIHGSSIRPDSGETHQSREARAETSSTLAGQATVVITDPAKAEVEEVDVEPSEAEESKVSKDQPHSADSWQVYSNTQRKWVTSVAVWHYNNEAVVLFMMDGKIKRKVLPLDSPELLSRHAIGDKGDKAKSRFGSPSMTPVPSTPDSTSQPSPSLVSSVNIGSGIHWISQAELVHMFDRSDMQIIDVRTELEFFGSHLRGAWNRPYDRFEKGMGALSRELKKLGKTTLVFHCFESRYRSPKCAQLFASYACIRVAKISFTVCLLEGGFDNWVKSSKLSPDLGIYISTWHCGSTEDTSPEPREKGPGLFGDAEGHALSIAA